MNAYVGQWAHPRTISSSFLSQIDFKYFANGDLKWYQIEWDNSRIKRWFNDSVHSNVSELFTPTEVDGVFFGQKPFSI